MDAGVVPDILRLRPLQPPVEAEVLPDADDLLRRDAGSVEPDAEALVPQLTESLCGTRDAPARHVRVDGVRGNGPDRERPDRLGPVRLVAPAHLAAPTAACSES